MQIAMSVRVRNPLRAVRPLVVDRGSRVIRTTRRTVWLAGISAVFLGGGTAPALAAFPGTNGRVAFERVVHDGTASTTTHQIGSYNGVATVLSGPGSNAATPAWSADGTKLAFVETLNSGTESHIFVSDASGANPQDVSAASGFVGPIVDTLPAWSPGGRLVFVAGNTSNNGGSITIMNVDGASRHVLAWASGGDDNPAWSPDGTRIAFDRAVSAGFAQIFVANADGTGTPTDISSGTNDHSPTWSPDGTRLAFARSAGPNSEIVTQSPTDTTGASTIVLAGSGTGSDRSPAYSPDGSKIAFTSGAFQHTSIWGMAADGSGAAQMFPPAAAPPGAGSYAQDIKADWQVAAAAPAVKPVATGGPAVSNPPIVPNTLHSSDGTWANCDPAHACTFHVQWMRCSGACTSVGADSHDYALTNADVGSTVAACVTAANSAGSADAPACSSAVGPVTSPDTAGTGTGGTGPVDAGVTPPPSDPGVRPYVQDSALPPPSIFVSYNAPSDPYMRVSDSDTLQLVANDTAFVTYGCNVGQPSGHRVSSCQMTAYGPDGSVTPVGSGAADVDAAGGGLPTAYPTICRNQTKACEYTVRVDARNTDGVVAGLGFKYVVSPPPSSTSEQAALSGSINGQLGTIDSGFASLAQGYKTLFDSAHDPICFIAHDGKVIAAGSGNIIAAGSGNVIAAGSGNIIAAGSYNFQIVNGTGQTVGIIAAGSGNLQVIAADGVIAAGSGNIIAAGSGNVIAAGSGNVVSTFGGGIIAAGAYNLVPQGGASFGPQFNAAALPVSGLLSAGSLIGGIDTGSFAQRASETASRAVTARTRHPMAIARGKLVLGFHREKASLVLIFTPSGKRLIAKLAHQNMILRHKHKRLRAITLTLRETFTPKAGSKAITLARRFTITPGYNKRH